MVFAVLSPCVMDICILCLTQTRFTTQAHDEMKAQGYFSAIQISFLGAYTGMKPLHFIQINFLIISPDKKNLRREPSEKIENEHLRRSLFKSKPGVRAYDSLSSLCVAFSNNKSLLFFNGNLGVVKTLVFIFAILQMLKFENWFKSALSDSTGMASDYGILSVHIIDNAFLCATLVTLKRVSFPSFGKSSESTRLDLNFVSPLENFELPTDGNKFKCMERQTNGFSGKKLVSVKQGSRPNIISIFVESAKFEDWTGELKIGNFELTPNINALKNRGISWSNMYSTNFNTQPSLIPISTGRFSTRVAGLSCNTKIQGYERVLKDQLDYTLVRYMVDGYRDACPVDKEVHDDGRVRQASATFRDLDAVEVALEELKLLHNSQREMPGEEKPFYFDFRTQGTHHHWSILKEDNDFFLTIKAKDFDEFINRRVQERHPANYSDADLSIEKKAHYYKRMLKTIHLADKAVGRLIEELKASGMSNNTLIVFSGDHAISNHHMVGQTGFDENFHIPYILSDIEGDVLDDYEPGNVVDDLATNMDYGATLLDLLEVESYPNFGIGHSLRRAAPENSTRITYSSFRGSVTVFRNKTHTRKYERCDSGDCWEVQEFDRAVDPHQTGIPNVHVVHYGNHEALKEMRDYDRLWEAWEDGLSFCEDQVQFNGQTLENIEQKLARQQHLERKE
eukprot:Awhi_evm1s11998